MQRLSMHSSNPSVCLKEFRNIWEHLSNRGNPARAIDFCSQSFNWNQRRNMLMQKPTTRRGNNNCIHQYKGCVFSSCNVQGVDVLSEVEAVSTPCLRSGRLQERKSSHHTPSSQLRASSHWDVFYDGQFTFWKGQPNSSPQIMVSPVPGDGTGGSKTEALRQLTLGPGLTLQNAQLFEFIIGGQQ